MSLYDTAAIEKRLTVKHCQPFLCGKTEKDAPGRYENYSARSRATATSLTLVPVAPVITSPSTA